MNRRDFIKFMGVSSAATAASTALAQLPKVEDKIIQLPEPEIITVTQLPRADIIITDGLIDCYYRVSLDNKTSEFNRFTTTGQSTSRGTFFDYDVQISFHVRESLLKHPFKEPPETFSFMLDLKDMGIIQYSKLNELNNRVFYTTYYKVDASADNIITAHMTGNEIR